MTRRIMLDHPNYYKGKPYKAFQKPGWTHSPALVSFYDQIKSDPVASNNDVRQ